MTSMGNFTWTKWPLQSGGKKYASDKDTCHFRGHPCRTSAANDCLTVSEHKALCCLNAI